MLVSLDALLRERSVTRAAERLGLTQPALSAALRRLRAHFNDELLTRVGNSYQLTPLASFILGRVGTAMEGAERVFDPKPQFDPAECTREFVIQTSDYALSVVGPPLIEAMAVRAPRARIRFRQPALSQVQAAADNLRSADALLCPHGYAADLPHMDLCRDRWVCIVAGGNEAVGATLTIEHLAELPWVAALFEPDITTLAHKQLELLGARVRVQVVSDGFLSVPALVAGTGRVAMVQERVARSIPAELGIRVFECPFPTLPLVEALWWHPLSDSDPEHQLLRAAFSDVALELELAEAVA